MSTNRRQRPLLDLVLALEEHLGLLRDFLSKLPSDTAYIRPIAGELRVLVCLSSGTEGLLWRLVDELNVPDDLYLRLGRGIDRQHPQAQGLAFTVLPIEGPDGLPLLPLDRVSLKEVIKCAEAVYVEGRGFTHEELIKAVAQQIGSSHESDKVDITLEVLRQTFISNIASYANPLVIDAELTLQVGDRVIQTAVDKAGYTRKYHDLPAAPSLGEITQQMKTQLWQRVSEWRESGQSGNLELAAFGLLDIARLYSETGGTPEEIKDVLNQATEIGQASGTPGGLQASAQASMFLAGGFH